MSKSIELPANAPCFDVGFVSSELSAETTSTMCSLTHGLYRIVRSLPLTLAVHLTSNAFALDHDGNCWQRMLCMNAWLLSAAVVIGSVLKQHQDLGISGCVSASLRIWKLNFWTDPARASLLAGFLERTHEKDPSSDRHDGTYMSSCAADVLPHSSRVFRALQVCSTSRRVCTLSESWRKLTRGPLGLILECILLSYRHVQKARYPCSKTIAKGWAEMAPIQGLYLEGKE